MACEVADFLEQLFLERFPGVVDIVLVRSERWTEEHKALMHTLTEGVMMFFATAQAPVIRTTPRRIPEVSAVRSERRIASLPFVWSRTWSLPRRQR